jgi:adenylylsulfate kinase
MIYWLTGQPGHGKTVLSDLLKRSLDLINKPAGKQTVQVDGDDLRELTVNKDYSEQGRINNIRNAQMIAQFCHNKGMDVIVSLVSPYRWLREEFKERMEHHIIEFYIFADEPRERDHFHVDNYEPPEKNFYLIDTTVKSPMDSLKEITDILEQNYVRL